MSKRLKPIPKFASEAEEAEFWMTHDTTEYVDWSKADRLAFPALRPSTERVTIRMPSWLLARIKKKANEHDIPYQTLIKVMLARQIDQDP